MNTQTTRKDVDPPMRQGVLWQSCPTCDAQPGELCTNTQTGYILNDYHRDRPDGYDDELQS